MALVSEPYTSVFDIPLGLLRPLQQPSMKVCTMGPGWWQPGGSYTGLELGRARTWGVWRVPPPKVPPPSPQLVVL